MGQQGLSAARHGVLHAALSRWTSVLGDHL